VTRVIAFADLTPDQRDEIQLAYLRRWLGQQRRAAYAARLRREAEGPPRVASRKP